ncbi:SDR family NAD(P)-dependent oxidoreductase [Novosphingobium sp. BL-8A]|uniref:SDR family NAD(P)-dependent oxidoreductase n=1 Tax=Novosphingobium sp. BL-8A TaxID=3127639 RepID=UPI0037571DCB
MSLFDLTGKVVLATGGMSGIGLAFLQGCARQGASVAVLDRDTGKAAEVVAHLERLGAARVHVESVDVTDEAAVDAAFAGTLAALGRIDCAFANAGISHRAPGFDGLESADYHRLMDVNLHGAFYTLRAAVRHMKERAGRGDPGGSIVACGSLSIYHGLPGMEHYAAAKAALQAMIKGLAVEMGPYGVRANMLVPGFILTGLTADKPETKQIAERFAAITPLGRPGEMSDIEGPAAYLASDASKFQSGDTMVIDGGRLVRNV